MDAVNLVLSSIANHFRSIVESSNASGEYNEGFLDGLEFCINEIDTEINIRERKAKEQLIGTNRAVKSSKEISPEQLERLRKDREDSNNKLTKTMVRSIEWKKQD